MNKVITINLGGNAYQLEEGGYDALRAYLENAAARLQSNPDRDEIVSDIERAIAEKFRALLGSHKTVIETKEVAAVVADMGPIEAEPGEAADPANQAAGGPTAASGAGDGGRRTNRLIAARRQGDFIESTRERCSPASAMESPPILASIRLSYGLRSSSWTMFWGTGLLVYVVMAIVVPEATSPEEKAAASGVPSTAQEFIRRAKAGYYEAVKGFPDRKARREWQRRFKQQMSGWHQSFGQEMRSGADQWRHNWYSYWAEHGPVHPGAAFALPFLSLLHGAVTVLWVCASISLLAHGDVFGRALPANVPVWVAAFLLLVAYAILSAPLKAARGRFAIGALDKQRCAGSIIILLEVAVWLVIAATLLCLAVHYSPELSEAVKSIPSLGHQAADDVRTWWKPK